MSSNETEFKSCCYLCTISGFEIVANNYVDFVLKNLQLQFIYFRSVKLLMLVGITWVTCKSTNKS